MEVFKTKGVCAKEIKISIEDKIIADVEFVGGCPGNSIGIEALVKGRRVEEVIERLSGVKCGPRKTSCPDQLAESLKKYV